MIVFLLVAAVGASGLTGCSDAKSRRDGRDILDRVSDAQQLYDKAVALLDGVVFKVGGEIAPLTALRSVGKIDPTEIRFFPEAQLNREAWKALGLDGAEENLSKTLQGSPEAGDGEKALGEEMLGRIATLKGYYRSAEAARTTSQINAALTRGEQVLSLMRAHADVIRYIDKKLGMTGEELKADLEKNRSDAAKLGEEVDTGIPGEIAALTNERKSLLKTVETLRRQASELRREIDRISGAKRVPLLEEAQIKDQQVSKETGRIAHIENRIAAMQARRETLRLQLQGARNRTGAIEAILETRRGIQGKETEMRARLSKELGDYRTGVDGLCKEMLEACSRLTKSTSGASNAYVRAEKRFGNAARLFRKRPGIHSQAADALMGQADLEICSRRIQARITRFTESVEKLWPALPSSPAVPEPVALLKTVTDVTAAKDRAEVHLGKAVDLYRKSISSAERNLRWASETKLAAAHYVQYRLTGNESFKTQAGQAIKKALKDKTASPYLASAVELERIITSTSGQ